MRAHAPRLGSRDCMALSGWCIGCVSRASGPTRSRLVPGRAAERRTQQNARRNHRSRPSPEPPMQAPASRVGSDPGPLRARPTIPARPVPRLGTYPRVSRKMRRIWGCCPRSVHKPSQGGRSRLVPVTPNTTKRPKEPPVPSVSRVADTSTSVPGRFGSRAPSSRTYDRVAPLPRLGIYPRVSRKMPRIWRCRPRSVHRLKCVRASAEPITAAGSLAGGGSRWPDVYS